MDRQSTLLAVLLGPRPHSPGTRTLDGMLALQVAAEALPHARVLPQSRDVVFFSSGCWTSCSSGASPYAGLRPRRRGFCRAPRPVEVAADHLAERIFSTLSGAKNSASNWRQSWPS